MPPRRTTPTGYLRARQLRKEPTPAEATLWAYLRRNKLKGEYFRRQHAIDQYIVDFCTVKKKIVIELDGSQHLEQADNDKERTEFLEFQGYSVLRFWNDNIMGDIEGVIRTINLVLRDTPKR
jgi:very-short-patch-repair endonuclease